MPIPVIDGSGRHEDIGYQHGRAMRSVREDLLRRLGDASHDDPKHSKNLASRRLTDVRRTLETHSPDTIAQLDGIATGIDIPFDDLLSMVVAAYLKYKSPPPSSTRHTANGCTVWAASSATNGSPEPLLVKNRDQPGDSLSLQMILRARPANGIPWLAITTAGAPGVHSSGINQFGLSIADTAVPSNDVGAGLPRFSLMMHVLEEYENVESALAYLVAAPMMGAGNLVLIDQHGRMAVVETGYQSIGISRRSSGELVSTNHFVSAALEREYRLSDQSAEARSSRNRLRAVTEELRTTNAYPDKEFAKAVMARHGGPEDSICQHGALMGNSETISCAIFQPARRAVEVSYGNPCLGRFESASLGP